MNQRERANLDRYITGDYGERQLSEAVAPNTTPCQYCANQGIRMMAHKLKGSDGEVKVPNTARYGCANGHKFAI